jgi:hypothetical protein
VTTDIVKRCRKKVKKCCALTACDIAEKHRSQ